jgi:biotin transport system substrate-specific component
MSDVLAGRESVAELGGHRHARRIAAVLFFALLTAAGAAIEVPVPGTPVPMTLQTLFVSLAGVLLGPVLGAASQAIYLLAGTLGAPVFSGGEGGLAILFRPTGGYLLSFPLAAAVTAVLAGPVRTRWTVPSAMRLWLGILAGTAVIFAGGVAQLAWLTGDSETAVRLGVLPFITGDLLKVTGAFLVALRLRARTLGWL